MTQNPGKGLYPGFALVVTLALMILLTVIAVGLLSLSAVTLRTAGKGAAHAAAQANARMALMMAIGELQSQLGPDQRASASGSVLAETSVLHPHWTGVWNSWRAGANVSGTTNPDIPSEHRTIAGAANGGLQPTYAAQRKDHFRSWLVSLDPTEAREVSSAQNLSIAGIIAPGKSENAVQLVGKGSLGSAANPEDFVSARLLPVQSTTAGTTPGGRFGWWVGDESQKARIMDDSHSPEGNAAIADRIFRHQAPGSTGTKTVKGLENLTDDKQLALLPSLQSVNLVAGSSGKSSENFHSITPHSYQVLADVREGGLKRDLTTLLERPIKESETSDEFMLYKFTTKDAWLSGPDNQECVPIQDLAAYYQLYDSDRTSAGWKEGTKFSSNVLPNGMQTVSPDFGADKSNTDAYQREYTTLYRSPVPIKVQFLLSLFAEPIPPPVAAGGDTHKLIVGVTPAVTLWNPNNLPLVMRFGSDPNFYAQLLRMGNLPLQVSFNKNSGQYVSPAKNLFWFVSGQDDFKPHLFNLYFSGTKSIRFAPGEVKVFSLPYKGDVSALKAGYSGNWNQYRSSFFFKTDKFYEPLEVSPGWDPRSFMFYQRSAPVGSDNKLPFKAGDKIAVQITGNNTALGEGARGSWVNFFMIQTNHQSYAAPGTWERRNYQIDARTGTGAAHDSFNSNTFAMGFKNNSTSFNTSARSGAGIIARASNQEGWPFLQFSFMAGTETSESSNGGSAGGRKFASRPFLHSTAIAPTMLDGNDGNSCYNYGWNWWVEEINDVTEAPVAVSASKQGYYGGGYGPESGTTHVVQCEIPVVPPLSIAALSHAHLGGFSIARDSVFYSYNGAGNPGSQRITATGQAGFFPHTLQAIGNSYAHPAIAANQAYTTARRVFNTPEGAQNTILADHSYLANKALWDDYFFSSISPIPSSGGIFGSSSGRSAQQLANDFFFGTTPLPNRRMVPYTKNLDPAKLNALLAKSMNYTDGLADRIAAFMMVEGAFNINSTSVDAWKVFLSSLRGKKVAFLNKDTALTGGVKLDEATPAGTPVGPSSLPNTKPVKGSSSEPSDADQWTSWRELTDAEIDQLARAVVKQVKLRGPFLSLSEFVNRRLDSSNKNLSVKGALQAALDDESVDINKGFRTASRRFGNSEIASMNPAFPEALAGPVAYGSAAYVDQADILRNFAEQLTQRGDTFVIRAYGDSLNTAGQVEARAWCEAVVQRVPDYLDPADESQVKQASLKSAANKTFGRQLRLVTFRWLNQTEV